MGGKNSKSYSSASGRQSGQQLDVRGGAITGATARPQGTRSRPPNFRPVEPADYDFVIKALGKLLLFTKTDQATVRKVIDGMWVRECSAGEVLITQGDTGIGASELYVVRSGEFEVLELRKGVNWRVNCKGPGDVFGEVSLLYNSPRNASVAATTTSTVIVLERAIFRAHVQKTAETEGAQVELFLNSVPLLKNLSSEERARLADALEEFSYTKGTRVVKQGDPGDLFYIIKEGEAVVYQEGSRGSPKVVNRLFKSDFFGEQALMRREPRMASVEAVSQRLVCLALQRKVFVNLLGDLHEIMNREKSPQVVSQRLMRLDPGPSRKAQRAWVHIKRRRQGANSQIFWEVVHAHGHLDEVQALCGSTDPSVALELIEGKVLGGGAFSRVSKVMSPSNQREYALKRMRKATVLQCPEHVFCEQRITRNTAHPFCIRQYASFQDKYHLYFLFDLLPGGDLMDVLGSEAKIITQRTGTSTIPCMSTKTKVLKGMSEPLVQFYIASITLALEYLHNNNIVYRDLKPENVFIDQHGYIKLGDFGFAKNLNETNRTFTFCGTPGYVAPENVLAHGYNASVDWWGLGVLMYVLLTGRQPFSTPRTDDPMQVMRRIVNDSWQIPYPSYLSSSAKDLISRLLERKPARRIGMQNGKANDIKKHAWFQNMDWEQLESRRLVPPRLPREDSQKRILELMDAEANETRPEEDQAELAECNTVFADF